MRATALKTGLFATALALTAPHGAVANPIDLPSGCTGLLTIQLANCTVLNHWTCTTDPADHYRLVSFDATGQPVRRRVMKGLTSLQLEGATGDPRIMTFQTLDPESLGTLTQTGRDTYHSTAHIDGEYFSDIKGESLLTGAITVIDGVPLRQVQSTTTFTYASGGTARKRVMQYVMDETALARDIWVPGSVIDIATDTVTSDFSAVDFIWPGESDFMTSRPRINCGPATS